MENSAAAESETRKTVCLTLLRAANSDNEKLAGLLLVPKLFLAESAEVRSDQSLDSSPDGGEKVPHGGEKVPHGADDGAETEDKQFQIDLLAAIDFQFLRRMLSSGDTAADLTAAVSMSEEHASLKCAAVSVILCFSQQDVLSEAQINQVVAIIETILLSSVSTVKETDIADECASPEQLLLLRSASVQCLEAFCRDQSNSVLENILLPAIYRIQLKQQLRGKLCDELVYVVSNIVRVKGTSWMKSGSMIAICAVYLHHIKLSELAYLDFTLCGTVSRLLSTMADSGVTVPAKLHLLVNSVMGKLCDSLKNKLPTEQRQQALNLLTALIQIRGIKQLISEKGSKAALLVIHLCSIEVRMTLEQDDNDRVMLESETLCSSFFALEQMIFYMANEETTLALDSREVVQVHSALQGAVSAIIYFLTSCAEQENLDKSLYPVISACMRLLGAWTAEETESLLSKYIKVLPHLITVCFQMLYEIDSFKFLVPGLSNFTTDTQGIVDVIVDNVEFVCKYIEYCCTQLSANRAEYEHVLVNTCVVVLNCLMMPELKVTPPPLSALLHTVTSQTEPLLESCKNVDCNITMIVCALTTLRKLFEVSSGAAGDNDQQLEIPGEQIQHSKFYRKALEYMLNITGDSRGAGKKRKGAEAMVRSADVPEIWLMGVQVMGDLMKKSVYIKDILIEEGHIRTALKLFDQHSTNVDATFVLERLLLTMADQAGTKDLITKINKVKIK